MHTLIHKTETFQSLASQPQIRYLLMTGELLACISVSTSDFIDIYLTF